MISYIEAQNIIKSHARSFGAETVPLDKADGKVLTGIIRADRDYPPFNRATMDGYALRYEDIKTNLQQFRIKDTIYAGGSTILSLTTGECYKVMTGAAVPPSADIVIKREDTVEEGGQIRLSASTFKPFLNIARQGEDLKQNAIVIDKPCICEPSVIALLATLGQHEVTVARRPSVALVTTGNEVVPVNTPPGPLQIRNSNRWLLQSLLKKWQIEPVSADHAADDRSALKSTLDKALQADIVIMSGGVSAGDADYVPEMLQAAGVRQLFHKLAIKPGKPVWCGINEKDTMVFALPGNPFSCLVGFTLLIRPYLEACVGLGTSVPQSLPISIHKKKATPLDEFFPVRIQGTPVQLEPISLNGSGDIRLAMEANALALHPAASGDLEAGALTSFTPLSPA